MKALTDQTLIPIGLAITAFGGGAAWLTAIHFKINYAQAQIVETKETVSKLETKQDQNADKLNQILVDVRVMKVIMKTEEKGHR
jgi:uncharacterized UBP type Zn finger protein